MSNFNKVMFTQHVYIDQIDLPKKIINKIKKTKLTKNKYQHNNLEVNNSKDLIKIIDPYFKDTLFKIMSDINCDDYKFNFTWIQKYKQGHYHNVHTHDLGKYDYSFVLYLDCSDKSEPTLFYNVGYPYVNTDTLSVKPVIGRLVIFAGCLPHEVPPNQDDKRLIISGNLTFIQNENNPKLNIKKISKRNRRNITKK